MRQSPSLDAVFAAIQHDGELLRALRAERGPRWLFSDAIIVATAMVASRPLNPEAELQLALAGELSSIEKVASKWLEAVEPQPLAKMFSMAELYASEMRLDIQEVVSEEDSEFRRRKTAVLAHQREQLEALSRLMGMAPGLDPEPFRAQLRACDYQGEKLLKTSSTPIPELDHDVVMARAAIADPFRWWTRLVPMP